MFIQPEELGLEPGYNGQVLCSFHYSDSFFSFAVSILVQSFDYMVALIQRLTPKLFSIQSMIKKTTKEINSQMFTLSLKTFPEVLFHSLLTFMLETNLKTSVVGEVSQISVLNGTQIGNGGG